ncbi:YbaN family protein [Chloroflexota bacterium]
MKRKLLLIAGTVSTTIGIIGIVVPVLPTTPFLLLAAACYIRSSQKFYNWLLSNRILGAYISNYVLGKGMPLKVKMFTIALMWITIGLSLGFIVQGLVIRVIIIVLALGVTIHIIKIKTLSENNKRVREEREERGRTTNNGSK